MSTDTTAIQAIHVEFVTPDATPGVEPTVESPVRAEPETRGERGELSDRWIETQLARKERWRRPSWPLVCEVAERYRAQQPRPCLPQIDVGVAPTISESKARFEIQLPLPWGVVAWSLVLHGAIIIALTVCARPSADDDQHVLVVIGADRRTEALENVPNLLDVSVTNGATNSITATDPADCPVPPPPDVSLATFVEDTSGPVLDVHSLLNDQDGATTRRDDGQSGAEFFGVQATGDRIVFLIDCSVTMSVGTKWMEAMRQLTAAVEGLGEDQWFYVIFFSEESQRMFDVDSPEPHCLPATPENVERLRRWLLTIKTGMSTQPAKSVKFALKLDPDAIFLLSDGEYDRHDPTLELLGREKLVRQQENKPQPVVHTLSFLNSNLSASDKRKLQDIARQNGGRYVCVAQGPRSTVKAD